MVPAWSHGLMNAVRRARRYGSRIANTSTRKAPTAATSPSWRSGIPAATSIAPSVKQMTSAVPRSGCAAISSTAGGAHAHDRAGRGAEVVGDLRPRGDDRRRVQDERQLHQLGGLELERAGPDPAPRAVDLHPDARDQHEQQEHERDQQQVRRVAADVLEALAGDDLHGDQPDRAVREVLDEVGGAVAVALQQRAGARRRVDHHRAAREQAERGGEQQPVLERLRLLASLHRSWFRHAADALLPGLHPMRARKCSPRAS